MTRVLIVIAIILSLPLFACGSVKTGKNYAIDSPLKTSRTNKSLSDARQQVEKSRRELDQCLERYSGDETKCQREKDNYDRDVEEYATLQTQ